MTPDRLRVSVVSAASLASLLPVAPVVVRCDSIRPLLAEPVTTQPVESLQSLWDDPISYPTNWRSEFLRRLSRAAAGEFVTYVVPGDPLLGDATVDHLFALRDEGAIELEIKETRRPKSLVHILSAHSGSISFVDAIYLREIAGAAPFAGGAAPISSNQTTVVTNVENGASAVAVSQMLGRYAGPDVEASLIPMLDPADRTTLSLANLRRTRVSQTAYLVVPPASADRFYRTSVDLQRLVARLRAPDGCPWDREQTNQSLTKNLIEESYELLDAIDSANPDEIREELGDFILQAYLHCQIAEEENQFTLEDVLESLITKLVRRHPHVFATGTADDSDAVVRNWDEIKRAERAEKLESDSGRPFGNVPPALPALLRAQTLLKRARRSGMVDEELATLVKRAVEHAADDPARAASLKAILDAVDKAGESGVDLEEALRDWTRAFEQSASRKPSHQERS